MEIAFVKMEGLGNDFILIDDRNGAIAKIRPYPELARALCSRHFGIGADGILLMLTSKTLDMRFYIYNSDGSQAQMCGNGIRCFAKYAFEHKLVTGRRIRVETLAGEIVPEVIVDDSGQVTAVRVDMGEPVLMCEKIPFQWAHPTAVDVPLTVNGESYSVTAVSMGNPHAVLFVEDIHAVDIDQIGPAIETHPGFPQKTNVEFIQVVSDTHLRMRVWERGAGVTLACGTGACAALVAACLTGRSRSSARVELDGGDLEISWDQNTRHVFKTGPANLVFTGQITI